MWFYMRHLKKIIGKTSQYLTKCHFVINNTLQNFHVDGQTILEITIIDYYYNIKQNGS